jgi:hypothetical protein
LFYLQTIPCCAGAAVRFIYKVFLAVHGLLFALFTNNSFLCRGCCSLYLQTAVFSFAGPVIRFIYEVFLAVQGLLFALFTKSSLMCRGCC